MVCQNHWVQHASACTAGACTAHHWYNPQVLIWLKREHSSRRDGVAKPLTAEGERLQARPPNAISMVQLRFGYWKVTMHMAVPHMEKQTSKIEV